MQSKLKRGTLIKIGVIGLGKMGGPISKKLKPLHHDLVVYEPDHAFLQEYGNAFS